MLFILLAEMHTPDNSNAHYVSVMGSYDLIRHR